MDKMGSPANATMFWKKLMNKCVSLPLPWKWLKYLKVSVQQTLNHSVCSLNVTPTPHDRHQLFTPLETLNRHTDSLIINYVFFSPADLQMEQGAKQRIWIAELSWWSKDKQGWPLRQLITWVLITYGFSFTDCLKLQTDIIIMLMMCHKWKYCRKAVKWNLHRLNKKVIT